MSPKYLPTLFDGLLVTLELTLCGLTIGAILGLLLALMKGSLLRLIRLPAVIFIEFFRTTPFLVQVLWMYFVLPYLTGWDIEAFAAGVLALGLNASAFIAEIIRTGINAVGRGQIDAGRVLGLSKYQIVQRVLLPQAMRITLPAMIATGIQVLKSTSYLAAIGVLELTYRATIVTQNSGHFVEVFSVAGAIYITVIVLLIAVLQRVENRLSGGRATIN
jgi:His/Glu/Gln/Arg/opine family amino acid ABC transporter permease subunit